MRDRIEALYDVTLQLKVRVRQQPIRESRLVCVARAIL